LEAFSLYRHLIAGLCAASLLAGCAGNPDVRKLEYLQKGKAYAAQKKYPEATIEFKKAIQQDVRFAEAYFELGQAFAASGDLRNALPAYTRAADLAPNNVDANLKAGTLMLVARHFQDAKTRARAILVNDGTNVQALMLLGNALAGLQSLDDAVAVAERAAQLDPERAGLHSNVGVLELARGNVEQAETAFKRAVAADPKGVKPLLALANFYQNVGRLADAERTLRQAIANDPTNPRPNQILGTLLISTDRALEAEPFIKTATDRIGTVEARLALADYYLSIGKVDLSLQLLQQVASTTEGYSAGRIRTAMISYASGKTAEAHKILKEVLAKDPKNASALAVEGRLLLAEHKVNEALALATQALIADQRSSQAYVTLGQVHLARHAPEDARKAFAEALNNDPSRVDAQVELAKIHYARKELDTSIDYAQRGIKTDPNSLEAHLALVRGLSVRPDDLPKADAELRQLLAKYPQSSEVHSAAGVVLLARNDTAAARKAFSHALELNPDNMEALGGLTALDFGMRKGADARARVEARLAASPQPKADLLLLAAKIYTVTKETDKTEAMLRKLVDVDPSNLEAYNLLGQFYLATRKLDAARAEFTLITQREPKSVTAQTMLGLLAQAGGDLDGAKKAYEAAVQANPRAAAASNNLAWLYATSGGNLDTALQLAQSARAQMPDSAEVADTLGYVYYKKEMPGFAVPVLMQCVEKDANNPTYAFHLGLVYAQSGEDAKARQFLTKALKLNPKFEGADEAKRALTKLVY
jgi:putative PEP-CTERM system TPR-repeat lipoprotein